MHSTDHPEGKHCDTVEYLKQHSLVVVTAESCTAGLIASRLAATPGAGEVLESAFVVYDPKAKQRQLGVPAELMEKYNLTSEPVALAMARGALRNSDANLAIANTGVADDCDPEVEPGTQCYAWVFKIPRGEGGQGGEEKSGNGDGDGVQAFAETRVFKGTRNQVREASADYALLRIAHYHRQAMGAGAQ